MGNGELGIGNWGGEWGIGNRELGNGSQRQAQDGNGGIGHWELGIEN